MVGGELNACLMVQATLNGEERRDSFISQPWRNSTPQLVL